MPGYSLKHVQNHVLLKDLASIVATDRTTTARMLAHIAEVDVGVDGRGRATRTSSGPDPGRFGLQMTMPEETHELWCYVGDLLAPEVPRGDYTQRLHRALEALVEKIDRRRFGATDRPRAPRPSRNPDHIPAAVKRAVKARDGGRCTFESESGRRCEERGDLEYDHIVPKARGGQATVANLRLRCFAHNQLEAERAFGAGFMQAKRDASGSAKGRSAPPS